LSCNGIRKRSQRQLLEAITLSLLLLITLHDFPLYRHASCEISIAMASFYSNLLLLKCWF